MVLQGGPCGRVDRRRTSFIKALSVFSLEKTWALFLCTYLFVHIDLEDLFFGVEQLDTSSSIGWSASGN